MFAYIKSNVKNKIDGWHTRFLSTAGKETLIKAVAYAMPIFSMNVFKLPMELCTEIDSMLSRFWWGSNNGQRKLAWVSWKKMAQSKRRGGIGFRDIHKFNQALLANQVWKIVQRPDSLVYRVLQARYFKNSSLIRATKGTQPSYGWQSLLFGRDLLSQGLQFSIGDGTQTTLQDKWLPTSPPRGPALLPYTNPTLPVRTLFIPHQQCWDPEALHDLIEQQDHHLIVQTFLPASETADSFIWNYTPNGIYSVKSGYQLAMSEVLSNPISQPPLHTSPLATEIWNADTVPKLKHFLWRLGSRAIAVKENLLHRHIPTEPFCSRCCNVEETSNHVFFDCIYAQQVWRMSGLSSVGLFNPQSNIEDKLLSILHFTNNTQIPRDKRILPLWILWRLWKGRNELEYAHRNVVPEISLKSACDDVKEWLVATPSHEGVSLQHPPQGATPPMWKRPPRDWYKCNYDVSQHQQTRKAGMGWILRNSNGQFIQAGMGKFEGRHSIEEAEGSALIWAMQSCLAAGYDNIIFEGDNLILHNAVIGNTANIRLQHFLQTISVLSQGFTSIQFMHTTRSANRCADNLAKFSIRSIYDWGLYYSCPQFLMSVLNSDNDQF